MIQPGPPCHHDYPLCTTSALRWPRMKTFCALLAAAAFAQTPHNVTKADVEKWMTTLSNAGRWGKADQMGTVNLITAAKRKQAAALVREGVSTSLARTIETERAPDNTSPFGHEMTATGANPLAGAYAMDTLTVSYHGYGHTHMDSLSHMFYQGHMYNGYS